MPSFTIETAELKKKVNFVRNALGASKSDISVTLMRIEVTGNKAYLFASSKELFARASLRVARGEDAADGSFAVLGEKMVKISSEAQSEKMDFSWDSENLQVLTGFLTVNFELYDDATIRTVEKGIMPAIEAAGDTLPREALEEALVCAKSCTTATALRPDVTHAELRGGRVLSSDGRKIMIYSNDAFGESLALKVPAGVLSAVVSSVKNMDVQNVELAQADSYYVLKANLAEYALGIRKTERTFPQVEHQLSAAAKPRDDVAIDKHVLDQMLRGVAMGLPSEEVKVTLAVKGEGREAVLEASALNGLGRRSHEKSSAGRRKGMSEEISFPISFKHVLDTLGVFKGDSVVDLFILDQALMVKDKTETREVVTLIPFRTDKQIEQEKAEAAQLAEQRKAQTVDEKKEGEEAAEVAQDAIGEIEDDEPAATAPTETEDLELT